jgi:CheY-like chemotaxis protein
MSAATKIIQSPPTLLVVDDDPQLRRVTVRLLEQTDYSVRQGHGGGSIDADPRLLKKVKND